MSSRIVSFRADPSVRFDAKQRRRPQTPFYRTRCCGGSPSYSSSVAPTRTGPGPHAPADVPHDVGALARRHDPGHSRRCTQPLRGFAPPGDRLRGRLRRRAGFSSGKRSSPVRQVDSLRPRQPCPDARRTSPMESSRGSSDRSRQNGAARFAGAQLSFCPSSESESGLTQSVDDPRPDESCRPPSYVRPRASRTRGLGPRASRACLEQMLAPRPTSSPASAELRRPRRLSTHVTLARGLASSHCGVKRHVSPDVAPQRRGASRSRPRVGFLDRHDGGSTVRCPSSTAPDRASRLL